tara:strand:+ start:656 stop:3001 length:2346 start_codon:yes stop_codon:yes gene_type:complete
MLLPMKKRSGAILLAAGLASTVIVHLSSAAPETGLDTRNFIANGSFEELDSQGRPGGWTTSQGADPNENTTLPEGVSWAIDTDVTHDGQQSLRMSATGVTAEFASFHLRDRVVLRANRVYEFSLWMKAEGVMFSSYLGSKGGFVFQCFRKVGDQIVGGLMVRADNGTYDWKRFSTTFETTAEATLHPRTWRAVQEGTYWVDDISLREVEVVGVFPSMPVPELITHYPDAVRSGDGELALLFAPSTQKVLRESMPDEQVLTGGTTGAVSLARNEHEAIQVVMVPLWDPQTARDVKVTTTPLRHKQTGEVAEGARVNWHLVAYLGLHHDGSLVTTPEPDILLPAGDFSVSGQRLQPIWVDVYAGAATPAGDYGMQVTIEAGGASITASVNVHVYDFTLPRKHSLPTAVGATVPSVRELLYEYRLDRRVVTQPGPPFDNYKLKEGEYSEFADVKPIIEAELDRYVAEGGNMFMIPTPHFKGDGGSNHPLGGFVNMNVIHNEADDAAWIVRYHRELAGWLREKGLLDKGYIYIWDEPRPKVYENIRSTRRLLREADPEIRTFMPAALTEELADEIDVWVLPPSDWAEKRELVDKLRRQGKEFWWYNAVAGTQLEVRLIWPRLLFWAIWKNNIDGYLHWSVDTWRFAEGRHFGTLHRIGTSTDCWWSKGPDPYGGAGTMVLPAPGKHPVHDGILTPARAGVLPTIRLAGVRDGLEDYEYFVLLQKLMESAGKDAQKDDAAAIAEAGKLLTVPPEIVTSLKEYTNSDSLLRAQRDRIAVAIELLDGK